MYEHSDVRAVLPQRYPLLLVDRIVSLVPGESIQTAKAISSTEPCYARIPEGAKDWQYDYPPSLIIESLGQSAGLLWMHGEAEPEPDMVLMFTSARRFRFFGSARPGDVLRHEVKLISVVANTAFASGKTWIGERLVCSVDTLVAARRPVSIDPRLALVAGPGGFGASRANALVDVGRITMTPEETQLEELREMVAEVLEVEPDELTDSGDFIEDYEADSLRAIEILARIEKRYKVEIPQSELPELRTLKAVQAALARHSSK